MPVQPVNFQPQSAAPDRRSGERALGKIGLTPGHIAWDAGRAVEEALWSDVSEGKLTPDGKGGYRRSTTLAEYLFIPPKSGPEQTMGKLAENEPSSKEMATQPDEQPLDLNENLGQTVDEEGV